MKRLALLFTLLLFAAACQQQPKTSAEETTTQKKAVEAPQYPDALGAIFEAHGGINPWRKQRTLQYTIPKDKNPEIHITDLWSRNDKILTPNYSMGFDGKVWLTNGPKPYKGNPEFYHNLMFYFYAMPFVLADDGINYGETAPLQFEGKTYPGIQITYNDGVGTSPKDEYYIHYDPETNRMAWLGYTVTYRTGEDSDNIKWIRYDDWGTFNGLVLPKSISWYDYEGRDIKTPRSTVQFEEVHLSEETKPASFYAKPEEGQYWAKPEGD